MKIIQFVNNLDMGGLERLAIDLALCQQRAGHEPLLYCLTHRGAFANEAEAAGIPVTAFEKRRGPSPGTVRTIIKALRHDRPDVLHTHNHLVHHYGVAAGTLAGVPVIVNTRHRAEMQIKDNGQVCIATIDSPDRKADWIYRACMPWTDAVVTISESTRQFFIRHRGFSAEKFHVILNGAPLERFLTCPASPGNARPRIRFGTASRLVRDKDHRTLLAAFAEVTKSIPEAELHIAGDGPLRAEIESLVTEINLKGKITLHGRIKDMAEFLSQLDIFTLSSVNEGLPIAVLEAMAAGLPIVSTRVGGIDEAATEGLNATFSKAGDAKGLARAMIEMAQSPNLAEIGARGRAVATERFTIEHTWSGYEQLFDRLKPGSKRTNAAGPQLARENPILPVR